MAGLNENLAKRVAPDESDKAMSVRTRASIEKTFATMAEVGEGVLGDLIAGGGARSRAGGFGRSGAGPGEARRSRPRPGRRSARRIPVVLGHAHAVDIDGAAATLRTAGAPGVQTQEGQQPGRRS